MRNEPDSPGSRPSRWPVEAYARRTADEAAAFLIPSLRPGMRVLDVGCGPASITAGLARLVAPAPVVGIDIEDFPRAGGSAGGYPVFVTGSAYGLPFPAETFDVVYAHQVLQHLEDPVAALREIGRVLVPGGIVAVRDADYGTMVHAPRSAGLDRWLALYTEVARRAGGEPEAGRHLLGWVHRAGFVAAAATTSTWTFADPAARQEWAELWVGRLVDGALGAAASAEGLADADELGALADAWRAWSVAPDGFFAFFHGEVVARRPG